MDHKKLLSRPSHASSQQLPAIRPLEESLLGRDVRVHDAPGLVSLSKPPLDFETGTTLYRISRMVTEDFPSLGEYVVALASEFERVEASMVYILPKNYFTESKSVALEHRISVLRADPFFELNEKTGFGRIEDHPMLKRNMECAFLESKPMLFDFDQGIRMVFGNLDIDSAICDVYKLDKQLGSGSVALMPFYYRDQDNPSGIVVLEGDLRCRGSSLEAFAKAYWVARASNAAAHQISAMLTHKYDFTTILTKKVDFEVDLKHGARQLVNREISNLYLVFIDVDDFKKINDTHGHSVGDMVLRSVAETLKVSVRANDAVSRWGGEEFAAILRSISSKDEALSIAERIRTNVAGLKVISNKGKEVSVTCSIGVSDVASIARRLIASGITGDLPEEIANATKVESEEQLKKAKSSGKDKVCFVEGDLVRC